MPADWPSSGAADSQVPRWALASLRRSVPDACGMTANKAARIAAPPAILFIFPLRFIAAPRPLRSIAHLFVTGAAAAATADGERVVDWPSGSCNCIRPLPAYPVPMRGIYGHSRGRGPPRDSAHIPEREYWNMTGDLDLVALANGAIDAAMDDIVAKLLTHLKLDASNITSDALFQRVVDLALASVTVANMFALVGAIFFVTTLLMRTMVPLRVAGIMSDVVFIAYGVLSATITTS